MRIAVVQIAVRDDESRQARFERGWSLAAGCRGADLVVLPETWATGYFAFDRYEAEAEPLEGQSAARAAEVARSLGAYVHLGSFVERAADGSLANASALFDREGNRLAVYRKIHLFGLGSEEKRLLRAGAEVVAASTDFGVAALATCYDLRFPELFRRAIGLGTDIFLVCSAWPQARREHWLLLNRVRALENQALLVSANCAGSSRGAAFCGHSQVVDPWGTVIASTGEEETILWAEADTGLAGRQRQLFPFLKDRALGA